MNPRIDQVKKPEWVCGRVPPGFWDDPVNQRRFVEWLGRKLGIKKLDDWYRVTAADFTANRAIKLLRRFKSFHEVFERLFPEHGFVPWLFHRRPRGYWLKPENRRRYMAWLAKKLGYARPEDWYQFSRADFCKHSDHGLLSDHRWSLPELLAELYPDFEFQVWRFGRVPDGFWRTKKNRLKYMKWLEGELGYRRPTDWFNVRAIDFAAHSGGSILHVAGKRPHQLVADLYPDRTWHPWLFAHLEHHYWDDRAHRATYLKWLGKHLGFRRPADWFGIQRRDFARNHGYVIVDQWAGEYWRAIKERCPGIECEPWMLERIQHGSFWDQQANRRRYMVWLGKRLGIKRPEDWYQVRQADLRQHYGKGLLHRSRSIPTIVQDAFPEHSWIPWRFGRVPRFFWSSSKNRNAYFDWLAARLSIRRPSDWDRVEGKDIRQNHGGGLLCSRYRGTTRKLVADARKRWIESRPN